jgi:hypothetical protein
VSWLLRQILPTTPFEWASMLVRALAWPATSLVIVALLRAEVRLVLERMIRLRYRGFEAHFRHELGEVERLEDPPSPRRLLDLPSESRRVLHELGTATPSAQAAYSGPRATIDAAWAELAAAANRAAGPVGVDPAPAVAVRGMLSGAGLLAFERLRQLHRRLADAPGWEPPPAIAEQYAALARPLAARLAQPPALGDASVARDHGLA